MLLLVHFGYVSSNSYCVLLKVEASRHLEAFSIQLVSLAIWKQALDICHTQAASAIEGSPNQETIRLREITKKGQASLNIKKHLDATNILGPENVCSHIEKAFLSEVGNAEELAKHIEPGIFSVTNYCQFVLYACTPPLFLQSLCALCVILQLFL